MTRRDHEMAVSRSSASNVARLCRAACITRGGAGRCGRAQPTAQRADRDFQPAPPWRGLESKYYSWLSSLKCFPEEHCQRRLFNHPITVSVIGKISCETGKLAR